VFSLSVTFQLFSNFLIQAQNDLCPASIYLDIPGQIEGTSIFEK
jgi:hypothetical protein